MARSGSLSYCVYRLFVAVFIGAPIIMVKMGKLVVFAVLALVALGDTDVFGLDTANIEQLQKNVAEASGRITASGEAVIGDFISAGLDEILLAEDIAEIFEIRDQLVRFASSSVQPSEYSLAYIRAMKAEIPKTLDKLGGLEATKIKSAIELNLMILFAQLKSSELAEYALPFISHSNAAIKYWGVKAVANRSVARQLNSDITGDEELRAKIISSLMPVITEETPAVILDTIVNFTANLKGLQGKDLLKKICVLRTKGYADWAVTYEVMDAGLLNAVAETIVALEGDQKERAEFSRIFAQLYSYVMQRFILGGETLDENTKRNLIRVMLDVEEKGLSKIMGSRQMDIKQAVNSMRRDRNPEMLGRKHDAIFGSSERSGTLQNQLKFNYVSPAGRSLNYPVKLKVVVVAESN